MRQIWKLVGHHLFLNEFKPLLLSLTSLNCKMLATSRELRIQLIFFIFFVDSFSIIIINITLTLRRKFS